MYVNTEQITEESSIDLKVLETCLDEITEQGDDGSWLCKKCGKKDKSKFHLRRHAEIHLEGFKHPCNFCEREFSQRALVKAHMLRNHSEERAPKPFNCDICNMPSTSMSAVKVHKQRQHPIIWSFFRDKRTISLLYKFIWYTNICLFIDIFALNSTLF